MNFAQRLKELRTEKDLTQDALAIATGLSHGCIAMLETNKRAPTGSTLMILAEYFEVSTDYLLGLETEYGAKKYSAPAKNEKLAPGLTQDEQKILQLYRKLSTYNRMKLTSYAEFRLEEQEDDAAARRK